MVNPTQQLYKYVIVLYLVEYMPCLENVDLQVLKSEARTLNGRNITENITGYAGQKQVRGVKNE